MYHKLSQEDGGFEDEILIQIPFLRNPEKNPFLSRRLI